jgi:hypothetical protein
MNIYSILLRLAHFRSRTTTLERVLDQLAEAVHECEKSVDRAKLSGNEDYIDSVVDDECDVVESILGTAFVVSQAEITALIAPIKRIHKRAEADGHILRSSDGTKLNIMTLGSPIVAADYSKIQVIDAFANYLKHRDEWVRPWAKADGNAKRTVEIIRCAGAEEGSSGNLRSGLKALGIQSRDLRKLLTEVTVCEKAVANAYENELVSLKLL